MLNAYAPQHWHPGPVLVADSAALEARRVAAKPPTGRRNGAAHAVRACLADGEPRTVRKIALLTGYRTRDIHQCVCKNVGRWLHRRRDEGAEYEYSLAK